MVLENLFKKFLYLDVFNFDLELVLFLFVGYKKMYLIVIIFFFFCIKINLNIFYRDLSFIYDNYICCIFYV